MNYNCEFFTVRMSTSVMLLFSATTITFSFVGPAESGGLLTTRYAVQYKKSHLDWNESLNKTWPVGKSPADNSKYFYFW